MNPDDQLDAARVSPKGNLLQVPRDNPEHISPEEMRLIQLAQAKEEIAKQAREITILRIYLEHGLKQNDAIEPDGRITRAKPKRTLINQLEKLTDDQLDAYFADLMAPKDRFL